MKITRKQLQKIIKESVFQFPSAQRLEDRLKKTYNHMISMWDEGDPSMTSMGMAAWVNQVNNAIDFIRGETEDDLSVYDSIESEAYEMLIDGRFYPKNSMFMMRRKF